MTELGQKMINEIIDRATNQGSNYHSWSRSILHGLRKHFTFITDDIVRSAVLLAGGGDRATLGSCGVFSGGLMALSTRFAPDFDEPTEKDMESFNQKRLELNAFRDWFLEEFGSVVCEEVQKHQFGGRSFNLMDNNELLAFRDFPDRVKCREVIAKAALKLAEILVQEENSSSE